jgi:hypothetical protein
MNASTALAVLTTGVTAAAATILTLAPAGSVATAATLTPNARDTFSRTVRPGLGTADLGGSWLAATPAAFRVGPG